MKQNVMNVGRCSDIKSRKYLLPDLSNVRCADVGIGRIQLCLCTTEKKRTTRLIKRKDMSRLIDADVFRDEMKKRQDACVKWCEAARGEDFIRACGARSVFAEVKLTLDNMPTVDADEKLTTQNKRLKEIIVTLLGDYKWTEEERKKLRSVFAEQEAGSVKNGELECLSDISDRFEIVRCRDCKYWNPNGIGYCKLHDIRPTPLIMDDWFCADGMKEHE